MLIADKASVWEARNGTDDTKYMTPLKTKNQLQWLSYTGSGSNTSTTASNTTIYRPSDVPSGAKRVVITGKIFNRTSSYMSFLNINGTAMHTEKVLNTTYPSLSTTVVDVRYGATNSTGSFKIDIDLSTKTYTLLCQFSPNVTGEATSQANSAFGYFDTLTSVVASLRGNNSDASTVNYTVTYIY